MAILPEAANHAAEMAVNAPALMWAVGALLAGAGLIVFSCVAVVVAVIVWIPCALISGAIAWLGARHASEEQQVLDSFVQNTKTEPKTDIAFSSGS